ADCNRGGGSPADRRPRRAPPAPQPHRSRPRRTPIASRTRGARDGGFRPGRLGYRPQPPPAKCGGPLRSRRAWSWPTSFRVWQGDCPEPVGEYIKEHLDVVGVADRFDVVSIGPGVIAERQVPRVCGGGEHDHRQMSERRVLLDLLEGLPAVSPW